MAMKSIVEIDNVSRIFGGKVIAVDDVSLNVGEGEFITLLGPSGCGRPRSFACWQDLRFPIRDPSASTGRT